MNSTFLKSRVQFFINNLNYLIFYNDLFQNITIIVYERHRREFKRRLQFFFSQNQIFETCFLFVIFKSRDFRDSILNFSSIKNKTLTIAQ